VPSVRRSLDVGRIDNSFKAFSNDLLVDRKNAILWNVEREYWVKKKDTYRRMGDKVNDGDELAGVSINESLDPFVGSVVHNLNDVSEDN